MKTEIKNPECFGDLETVFPKGAEGLRNTPQRCRSCPLKTPCLRAAVTGPEGYNVRNEMIDRAYTSGRMTFWERWSKKKELNRNQKIRKKTKTQSPPS